MNYFKYDIVFQEIPDEISLVFSITGCSHRCHGCHSPELWNAKNGEPLTLTLIQSLLKQYQGSVSCVLFMGGEWEPETLEPFLISIRRQGLKTALYTGCEKDQVPPGLLENLDYLKTGPFIEARGGLASPTTNQKLFALKVNRPITAKEISSCL